MKFTILGCGSSMGVPRADGFFGNCNPNNKFGYGLLAFFFGDIYLLQWAIRKFLIGEKGYCSL